MKVTSENLPLKPLYNFKMIPLFILWQYGVFLTNNLEYKFHISGPFCLFVGGTHWWCSSLKNSCVKYEALKGYV